ncbi:MAG: hypothetical protein GY751_22985, partial [Bacteroidetes bacterium]|nr:hypothetical protein [Bacteroidota bacterium]
YIDDLVASIKDKKISISKGGEINIFSCNGDQLAKKLSKSLGTIGRDNMIVTGANNSVYPNKKETRAYVDKFGTFNSYKNGMLIGTRSFLPYGKQDIPITPIVIPSRRPIVNNLSEN